MGGMRHEGPKRRQRGWAGMLILLLALFATGFLVRSVLKQMGLSDGPSSAIATGNVQPSPVAGPKAPVDAPSTANAAPLERARAVQAEVLRQGAATRERLDGMQR